MTRSLISTIRSLNTCFFVRMVFFLPSLGKLLNFYSTKQYTLFLRIVFLLPILRIFLISTVLNNGPIFLKSKSQPLYSCEVYSYKKKSV